MKTVCRMGQDDKYSLHYEFSDQITKADKHNVAALMKNVLQCGNYFNLEQLNSIMNIATGAILEKDEEDFLMNCNSFGKAARNELYESRLAEKNIQLLETITKIKKSIKKKSEKKEYDLAKETFKFLRHIDYAHLQDFDLKILMGYEISPTCFYLTKGGLIRKPKSELVTELESMISKNIPMHLLPTNYHGNAIIYFMAYARKEPIKKQNLKTYNNFFISLWGTFSFLFKSCNRVDIFFDVYKENSIKASEQRWRTTGEDIEIIISDDGQPLPVEIDRFWSVSKNKTALQQLFTKWVLNKVKSEQPDKLLFLGGLHKENNVMC